MPTLSELDTLSCVDIKTVDPELTCGHSGGRHQYRLAERGKDS